MNTIKNLVFAALAVTLTVASCKKDNENISVLVKPVDEIGILTTDFMTDDFDAGWNRDLEGGSWWWQSNPGINWAIIHATATQKGRAEVSRLLTYYSGVDKTVTVKGKFKMETTADGYPNLGGWILQTMAWSFKDASGTTQYKPLVVARMLAGNVDYLVYDYVWDVNGNPAVKSGYPIIKNILSGTMAGQTIELALTIKFSRGSTGTVVANLNGTDITAANYNGVTYPSVFPYSNQQIEWKGGCYASYVGVHNAKIGVYYLYTDAY